MCAMAFVWQSEDNLAVSSLFPTYPRALGIKIVMPGDKGPLPAAPFCQPSLGKYSAAKAHFQPFCGEPHHFQDRMQRQATDSISQVAWGPSQLHLAPKA